MHSLEVFVLMPFGSGGEYEGGPDESDCIFTEIISPAVLRAHKELADAPDSPGRYQQVNLVREVDRNQSGSITANIVKALAEADVVVVDITGRNANVFLELGIRYALRSKVTVLMAQEGTQIPFDVQGYRYIEYNKYRPEVARQRLADFICLGLSSSVASDSVVFDVLPSMSVTIPGVASSFGSGVSGRKVMAFEDYMRRIERHSRYLEDAIREYRFEPDALIGISNGGLVAADLIGKRVFAGRDTPVLSLWAKRHSKSTDSAFWYFDNEYNDATMASILAAVAERPSKPPSVIIVDDHMGTGATAVQALHFVRERLGPTTCVVFIPIVSRRLDNIEVMEECLPYKLQRDGKPVFTIERAEFLELLDTDADQFPYLRKQVNVSTSG
jgi:hypoxanthine phosphoribosyltransferase